MSNRKIKSKIVTSSQNDSTTEEIKIHSVRDTLSGLLRKIKKVDYRVEAELESEEELTQKHYLVITIRELLKFADDNDWGLAMNNENLYIYNGSYWQHVDDDLLKKFLGLAARRMGVKRIETEFYQFKDKLMKQFVTTAFLPIPEKNRDVVKINLNNGTYEISSGKRKLRDFDKADFLKYKLPFNYNPNSKCPIFKKYLNRVLPDENLQKILAEYIGYVFITNNTLKLEKTLILYGSGANGKSVFFEIVNALIGSENISNFTLESLTNSTGYYRASLSDKLLNYASEISKNLNVDLFKQLVSGEPVEARQIYKKPVMVENYAKLMFNCNELPTPKQHKEAYFRRFIIVPFEETIPIKEQDPTLAQSIINSELPGIFNWVLEGLDRLLENKRFTSSEKVDAVLNKYRIESNTVELFLIQNEIKKDVSNQLHLKDMHLHYKEFCKDECMGPIGKTTFSNELKDRGFQVKRTNKGMVVYADKHT